MSELVFEKGQQVICIWADGYHDLTTGKAYEVFDFIPPFTVPTFTWPAYVIVRSDFAGKFATCHASRFKALPTAPVSSDDEPPPMAAEDIEYAAEQKEVERLKDEKRGLYPDKIDPSN